MHIKGIMDTNFQDYKKASMMISTSVCDWKCCKEAGCDVCQNLPLATAPVKNIDNKAIVDRYISNEITQAVVIAGLEPMDQFEELVELVDTFRQKTNDDIVIYTGYYENEITEKIKILQKYPNLIVKFGRFVPNDKKIFDNVLGINLISSNQYAKKIS